MRILITAHGYPPREPGVWTSHLAHALAKRHDVWLYAGTADAIRPDFDQWDEQDGPVRVRRVVNNQLDPFRYFTHFRVPQIDEHFLRFLDDVQPDVVHFEHVFRLSATMLGCARTRGIPTILSLYDYWWLCQRIHLIRPDFSMCPGPSHAFDCVTCVEGEAPGGSAAPWRTALHDYRQNLMRTLMDSPDVVTACSRYLRDHLTAAFQLPPGRIRVVPLGVPPLPAPVVHSTSDKIRICCLGAVAPHKGTHILAEAASRLTDPRVEIHAYGSLYTPYLAALRRLNDRIHYHGLYDHSELSEILGETDVLVLPTLARETFSFVIREAALANVPVVASRIGAIPEYIRDGENGILVTPGSVDELADALRRLVEDSALRARLAASHRPMRTIEDYTHEMEETYQSTVRKE